MRRRLVTTYIALLTLVLVALELPLASAVAAGRTEEVVIDRLLDASRFTDLAGRAIQDPNHNALLTLEFTQYYDVHRIQAGLVKLDGDFPVYSGDREAFDHPAVKARIRQAFAGDLAGGNQTVWPWQPEPIAVAVPVIYAGLVLGVVVTISPTDRLRGEQLHDWAADGLAGLVALVVFVVVAFALARWILRPVAELESTARRMDAGELESRVPVDAGPPEVRQLARSFNQMADHLVDVLGRQRAFVAQASHQLRNPLTALRIRVDNLAGYVLPEGRQEHRLVLEETDRLGKILEGLLALARAERGDHPHIRVDAAEIADERVDGWRMLAVQREIKLRRAGVAQAPVQAVATAVDQSLDALIDNSLKFAGPGATVVVTVTCDPDATEVHVVDDGPGLTEAECRRATERLWRAPTAQNIDGAGLGLPIATVLMEASGGTLYLTPLYPHGLRVTLRFPVGVNGVRPAVGLTRHRTAVR